MATNTVDRAGKLPRRFMTNQSLGAPIERGTTSLFNHCVRPGPATALAGRFTSKTASQLTNVANGLNEEHSGQSAQRLRMHVHRLKAVIDVLRLVRRPRGRSLHQFAKSSQAWLFERGTDEGLDCVSVGSVDVGQLHASFLVMCSSDEK